MVYSSFKQWGTNLHYYDQHYVEFTKKLREIELNFWKVGQFVNDQSKYERQYKFHDQQTYQREYPTNYNIGSWQGVSAILDPSGRLYGEIAMQGGNSAVTASIGKGGFTFGFKFKVPLVIDLKNDGIKLTALENSTAFYDIDDKGYLNNLGWPDKEDALLVVDVNGDGIISQAKEIVFKLWHEQAETDFEGLRLAFDKNNDGKIDKQDPEFDNLKIWQDHNQNGISEPGELKSLPEAGIETLLLDEVAVINGDTEQGGNNTKSHN